MTWTLAGHTDASGQAFGGVRSLTRDDIGVVFQPIVEVATGRLFAQEALVRCRRPEYAAPPKLFEEAVKESATGRLGRLIREVAFSTCGDVPLFVNLHPDELSARWLVRPDDPLCFHSNRVFLEVTETAAFTHFELCLGALKELCRRTGAQLVVDDFGAGYSNLHRLVELQPSVVKLDLALVRNLHENPRKQIVVKHVVNLCNDLGASVVAEGVETLDELSCVRDLGVSHAQGYLLARPAAPAPQVVWPFAQQEPQALPRRFPLPPSAKRKPPPLPPKKSVAPKARVSRAPRSSRSAAPPAEPKPRPRVSQKPTARPSR
jgi:EAL domain-containing protein (putative c-di-GMP-specific phosphodiesterase class I)